MEPEGRRQRYQSGDWSMTKNAANPSGVVYHRVQISLLSVQRAVNFYETIIASMEYDRRTKKGNHAMYKLYQRWLDHQSNVFAATVWSLRHCFAGDHQTVFDTLAEVWRNGFYPILEPQDI
jgi:hypothetical protein